MKVYKFGYLGFLGFLDRLFCGEGQSEVFQALARFFGGGSISVFGIDTPEDYRRFVERWRRGASRAV